MLEMLCFIIRINHCLFMRTCCKYKHLRVITFASIITLRLRLGEARLWLKVIKFSVTNLLMVNLTRLCPQCRKLHVVVTLLHVLQTSSSSLYAAPIILMSLARPKANTDSLCLNSVNQFKMSLLATITLYSSQGTEFTLLDQIQMDNLASVTTKTQRHLYWFVQS